MSEFITEVDIKGICNVYNLLCTVNMYLYRFGDPQNSFFLIPDFIIFSPKYEVSYIRIFAL